MNDSAPQAGRVDTHLHLLPGLDDGPPSLEEALAMAEVAIADGTTHAIATAHANYHFSFVPEQAAALCAEVQSRLGGRLQVACGCEVHLSFENVGMVLANPRLYSLNGSRYVLCEFPEFFERHAMMSVLDRFRALALVPVLAHPERNPVFQRDPDLLLEYLRLGCLSQVTASSFHGRFGKVAQQFSHDLLQQGRIHLVASDGHSADKRSPRLGRAQEWIEQQQGPELAAMLCAGNPMSVWLDRALAYTPSLSAGRKKSLWSRLRTHA